SALVNHPCLSPNFQWTVPSRARSRGGGGGAKPPLSLPPGRRLIVGPWRSGGVWIVITTRSITARSITARSVTTRCITARSITARVRVGAERRLTFLQDHDRRADRNAVVKIDDVLIEQADASAGHLIADRIRLVRSVEAEVGVLIAAVEIKRSRSQRIADAARQPVHVVRIDRHSANHVSGRRPVRPFGLSADDRRAAKIERFLTADADRIADCHAAGLNQIQSALDDVHDDRSRSVRTCETDMLAKQAGIDLCQVEGGNFVPLVDDRAIGGPKFGGSERIEAGPGRYSAVGCATPEQQRDCRKDATAVDNRGHCSDASERLANFPNSTARLSSERKSIFVSVPLAKYRFSFQATGDQPPSRRLMIARPNANLKPSCAPEAK